MKGTFAVASRPITTTSTRQHDDDLDDHHDRDRAGLDGHRNMKE